jgi:hypothetical protein
LSKNERSWGSNMKIKAIFIFLGTFLISFSLHAGECESAKSTADTSCDGEKLQEIKAQLAAAEAQIRATPGRQGSAQLTQTEIAQVEATLAKTGEFRANCVKAIEQCSNKCMLAAANASASGNIPQANADNAARDYCTQGKPQQVAEEAKKDEADMGKTLGGLAQLLSSLTGLIPKTDTAAVTDECTVSATNSAATVKNNPNCSTDVATTSSGTTFATGDYRAAKGVANASSALGSGDVAMGTPAKQELAAASAGGGGSGSGAGGSGAGGRGSGAGTGAAAGGKDDKALPSSNFGAGGGGGKSASGGAGGSGKPGAPGQITRAAIDEDRLMQAAVDKAMQQRGPASEGPPGGISGAFSLDNFIKVEKRMQNERNQLNEL